MKQYTLLLWAMGACFLAQAQLQLTPHKPQPGTAITLTYNPANTNLARAKEIEAIAYLMEGRMPLAKEITLKASNGHYTGTLPTNDSTRAVFITFIHNGEYDNNNDSGYYTLLYDNAGAPVSGAAVAAATIYNGIGGIWNLKRNSDKALELFQKGFSNTGARKKFRNEYWLYLGTSGQQVDTATLRKELQAVVANPKSKEADLEDARYHYQNYLKDNQQAAAITVLLQKRFPKGKWLRDDELAAMYKEKSYSKCQQLFSSLEARYGAPTQEDPYLDRAAVVLARIAADSGDYKIAEHYISRIQDPLSRASQYNNLAWKLSGEGVINNPIDASIGKAWTQKALAFVAEEKRALANKPTYRTAKQWLEQLNYKYASYANTYATNLYHTGEYEEAYAVQRQAVDITLRKDARQNETFALLTEKVKGAEAAQAELEDFITNNRYTPVMKAQLQRLYLAHNSQAQWDSYWSIMEQKAFALKKIEVSRKMINQPAPAFKLKDLNGQEVSLASLKGKVVVVDFWATWCGPCIAAFPGMVKAQAKYENNPNVVFLYINTFEGGDDRQQKVTGFLAKHNYTFRVLYDELKGDDPESINVTERFGVEGIPTKAVIDPNGNTRFFSVGYGGSTDALADEVVAMIELATGK